MAVFRVEQVFWRSLRLEAPQLAGNACNLFPYLYSYDRLARFPLFFASLSGSGTLPSFSHATRHRSKGDVSWTRVALA